MNGMDRLDIFDLTLSVPPLPDVDEQTQSADVPWFIEPTYVLDERKH